MDWRGLAIISCHCLVSVGPEPFLAGKETVVYLYRFHVSQDRWYLLERVQLKAPKKKKRLWHSGGKNVQLSHFRLFLHYFWFIYRVSQRFLAQIPKLGYISRNVTYSKFFNHCARYGASEDLFHERRSGGAIISVRFHALMLLHHIGFLLFSFDVKKR